MKLAVVTILVLAAIPAALYASDLPALARREKARRDALPKDRGGLSRSYDDADLERYRRPSAARAEGAQRRFVPPPLRAERNLPQEEAYWRREWNRHRRDMDRLEAGIRRLTWRLREKRSRRRPGERLAEDPSVSLLEESIQSLREEKRRLDERFRDRARKEGALPGWIR